MPLLLHVSYEEPRLVSPVVQEEKTTMSESSLVQRLRSASFSKYSAIALTSSFTLLPSGFATQDLMSGLAWVACLFYVYQQIHQVKNGSSWTDGSPTLLIPSGVALRATAVLLISVVADPGRILEFTPFITLAVIKSLRWMAVLTLVRYHTAYSRSANVTRYESATSIQ